MKEQDKLVLKTCVIGALVLVGMVALAADTIDGEHTWSFIAVKVGVYALSWGVAALLWNVWKFNEED